MRSYGFGFGLGRAPLGGGGWVDPLKGPAYDLRLHNHRYQITGYSDCIIVSGAGSDEVNGRYYQQDAEHWRSDSGRNIRYVSAAFMGHPDSYTWAFFGADGPAYVGELDDVDIVTTPLSQWVGALPPPSRSLIREPQYRPWGMYQDEACAIAALSDGHVVKRWRDEITGKAYALSQDNSVIAGVLRFSAGVPEIEFNGSTEMTVPEIRGPDYSFNSTLAISAVVTSVFPHVTYDSLCGFDPLGNVYTGRSIFVAPPPEMVSLDAYGSSLGVVATVDPVELITVTASWRAGGGGRADLITNRGEVINGAVPMSPCNDVAFNVGRGNGGSRPIMRLRHLVIPTGLADVATMRMIRGGLESW